MLLLAECSNEGMVMEQAVKVCSLPISLSPLGLTSIAAASSAAIDHILNRQERRWPHTLQEPSSFEEG